MSCCQGLLMPFLYPYLEQSRPSLQRATKILFKNSIPKRFLSTVPNISKAYEYDSSKLPPSDNHLNPPPEDYGRTIFADKCTLTLYAGSGGHGCVSFLREKYVSAGPANGGDGGSGGNIYIQAVRGETSLHKLARRGLVKAGRGKNGQGKSKGGQRGEDVLIQVPVGTVVREVSRYDPVAEEDERNKLAAGTVESLEGDAQENWKPDKWILHPSSMPLAYATAEFPPLPRPRKSNLTLSQPAAPVHIDLSEPMEKPMLLAAGAVGGLGNPHFVTQSIPRPKFATR
ncbi:MAG: hypothetical protein Q9187_001157, partial [Circinaria calcarea]